MKGLGKIPSNMTRGYYDGVLKFILVSQSIRRYRVILRCHLSKLRIGEKAHIVIILIYEVASSNIR